MHGFVLIVFGVLFICQSLFAVQVKVQDPCSSSLWLDSEVNVTPGTSVGHLTVSQLEQKSIPFEGVPEGIHSIRRTVTGADAMEILSETEIRAYGWCFYVNGAEPDDFPHQIEIRNPDDVIYWFFAYAESKDGIWVNTCVPTHQTRPQYICGAK